MSAMSPRGETRAWMLTLLREVIPVFPSLFGKWDERKVQLKKKELLKCLQTPVLEVF